MRGLGDVSLVSLRLLQRERRVENRCWLKEKLDHVVQVVYNESGRRGPPTYNHGVEYIIHLAGIL